MNTQYPLARKDRLVIRELEGEALVYDLARNRALCLNRLASAVWKQSDGQRSARQIAAEISRELRATVDERTVWAVIDQLGRDHLLEYCIPKPAGVTRRQQLTSLGKAAAVAGPLIAVLASPSSAQVASCVPPGHPCVVGGPKCCNTHQTCRKPGADVFRCIGPG